MFENNFASNNYTTSRFRLMALTSFGSNLSMLLTILVEESIGTTVGIAAIYVTCEISLLQMQGKTAYNKLGSHFSIDPLWQKLYSIGLPYINYTKVSHIDLLSKVITASSTLQGFSDIHNTEHQTLYPGSKKKYCLFSQELSININISYQN